MLAPVRLLYVASEVHPFSKTGGLADVAGALTAAIARRGHQVTVVSPWYATLGGEAPRPVATLNDPRLPEAVRVGRVSRGGVEHLFLGMRAFERDRPYGFDDDVERFARFCVAVPLAAAVVGARPDVVHLNDWQTGLVAPILRLTPVPPSVAGARTVYSIHNLQYQGRWNPWEVLAWTGLPARTVHPDALEFWGDASCAKAGIVFADQVATVSPTYAREIQTPEFGFGLDGALRAHRPLGILNGIDTAEWDPAADPHLARPYADLDGKRAAREALARELGFSGERPILGMVSRLADQKGVDLLLGALPAVARGWDLAVLGAGEPAYEGTLEGIARLAPGRAHLRARFDEPFAHRLYAGADALAMPSRFEPCGLAQMIAMRYGTLPVVRRTGGLADTVPESRGYGFDAPEPRALEAALDRARLEWGTAAWAARARAGMAADFGWGPAVDEHLRLYARLTGN